MAGDKPGEDRVLAGGAKYIDFQTDPSRYRHWKLAVDGDIATLTMDVDENAGLFEGYQLKLNSYDLGVDIELADAMQRLRFEHPEVKVVVVRSGKNRVFCAGANIRMLAGATHAHKVNFCKFTNETRNGLEDSSENSGQRFITVVNGTAAGGGYELALATDHIMLADDGSAAVSLPEVPLLAVLPGTGGLTRVIDKRKVRRDHADFFCTIEEGIKGKRAVEWRLVDEIVPNSKLEAKVAERAKEFAAASKRNGHGKGITLTPLQADHRRQRRPLRLRQCRHRPRGAHRDHLDQGAGGGTAGRYRRPGGAGRSVLAAAGGARTRRRDPASAHQRTRNRHAGVQVAWRSRQRGRLRRLSRRQQGALAGQRNQAVLEARAQAHRRHLAHAGDAGRARLVLRRHAGRTRVRRRPLLHADRLAAGRQPRASGDPAHRDEFRPLSDEQRPDAAAIALPGRSVRSGPRGATIGKTLDAEEAEELGLVTFALDDIDWDDEVRVFLEERASFSPDGLTGMEANLRFAGPETMETKIFSRLTAWQNWIFQRPNAVGEEGALRRYGTGQKAQFDMTRV